MFVSTKAAGCFCCSPLRLQKIEKQKEKKEKYELTFDLPKGSDSQGLAEPITADGDRHVLHRVYRA